MSPRLKLASVSSRVVSRIAVTGFVSDEAGSVASANGVLLRELLKRGTAIDFFSKPSFVDPRPAVAGCFGAGRLRFIDCTNRFGDAFRRLGSLGPFGRVCGWVDSSTYHRGLVRAMRRATTADIDLWLGDWARGRGDRPVVSFVQGPPGTDARSVQKHRYLIERIAGRSTYLKLATFARWRLNAGLPVFDHSDHIILGSDWSVQDMIAEQGLPSNRLHALPYPIDLEAFQPSPVPRDPTERLRLLWLGRFVPRKRLDLFLDGLTEAIRQGCDVEAWVIGRSGFVPNYELLLSEFPYPERLKHWSSIPRAEIPSVMSNVDVVVQPSDDENFGSSVAESLACGVPVIVGRTNGTSDYLCERSVRLADDHPNTLAKAIYHFAAMKKSVALTDRLPSRFVAEKHFNPVAIAARLHMLLELAMKGDS